eukprot:15484966-Alexandrium_andersonii.AAC.1
MGAKLRDLRKQRFSESLPVLHCQEAEQRPRWHNTPRPHTCASFVSQDDQGLLNTALKPRRRVRKPLHLRRRQGEEQIRNGLMCKR